MKSNFSEAANAARESIVSGVEKLTAQDQKFLEGVIVGMMLNKEG